ncbi:MAG: hydroxylamine reductase [Candidatus Cloacimonadales bacterium]|jgi:hydroxylamine reductase|nr:hydroxylamine reductase [Candidatus Cloacimonadales bacterium]
MAMFCFQCQETALNKGCQHAQGMCGKPASLANLQDLLISQIRGLSYWILRAQEQGVKIDVDKEGLRLMQYYFATITNANWDPEMFYQMIEEAIENRERIKKLIPNLPTDSPAEYNWIPKSRDEYEAYAETVGVLRTENEDIRSLRELTTLGLKGISAYCDHAAMLNYEDSDIYKYIIEASEAVGNPDKTAEELTALVLKTGEYAVKSMVILDKANTESYGHPEPTEVNIGVGKNPGILISGHDLRDLEELLIQTEGTGVDVYTHGEMLPANAYPKLKKYKHLVGNYGGSWWHQKEEFESFNGPILFTTNCIVPSKKDYIQRMFTTGMTGYVGCEHIPDRVDDKPKDFSKIIEIAKTCQPPKEIETGKLTIGFAHNAVISAADKVIELIKEGKIKRFVVMGGCDGRHKEREIFTDIAKNLPQDVIILTAGCAKYRYNKLDLGTIDGIPRVLDAGQCNDSYSLVLIAMALQKAFGLESVNDLPLSFAIGWYEQKAVAVLLALLYLGIKNIHLGPTIPAFLSPNIAEFIVKTFNLQKTSTWENDIELILQGK